jgi:hypothetical protein
MSALPSDTLPRAVEAALADITARAAAAIAAEVPPDVTVSADGAGVRLTGRALSFRALTDARLRDFAAITRSNI